MSDDKYADDFSQLVACELAIRADLAELSLPEASDHSMPGSDHSVPGSDHPMPGSSDRSFSDLVHLIQDIKEQLEDLHTRIKALKRRVGEDDNDKRAARALARLLPHQTERDTLRASLRTATLKMKSNLDKRYERDRALLLEGNTEVRNRMIAQTKLDAMKQSSMLTDDLRKSRAILTGQVERSLAALQQIDETNKVIDQTILKHRTYNTVVRTGKGYLTKLKRREFTDRMLILFSLVVFLLVVLYIAKARIRFRLLSWLFGE